MKPNDDVIVVFSFINAASLRFVSTVLCDKRLLSILNKEPLVGLIYIVVFTFLVWTVTDKLLLEAPSTRSHSWGKILQSQLLLFPS